MSATAAPSRVPLSTIAAFIHPERIEAQLAPWIPDAADRAFVVRCILGEGPHHHRGANYVLLSLLGLVMDAVGGSPTTREPGVAVPMRLPPPLLEQNADAHFPLTLPVKPLTRLAPEGSADLDAMVDCLIDGPPQHALANAAMVTMLGSILERIAGSGPK